MLRLDGRSTYTKLEELGFKPSIIEKILAIEAAHETNSLANKCSKTRSENQEMIAEADKLADEYNVEGNIVLHVKDEDLPAIDDLLKTELNLKPADDDNWGIREGSCTQCLVFENLDYVREGQKPGVFRVHLRPSYLNLEGKEKHATVKFQYWDQRINKRAYQEDPMLQAIDLILIQDITPTQITNTGGEPIDKYNQ